MIAGAATTATTLRPIRTVIDAHTSADTDSQASS